MVDLDRLKELIEASGIKKQKLAEVLGITRQGLSGKLNGRSQFTLAEVKPLCEALNLSDEQRTQIFLS